MTGIIEFPMEEVLHDEAVTTPVGLYEYKTAEYFFYLDGDRIEDIPAEQLKDLIIKKLYEQI
jgi:hypothetical protein